MRIGCDLDGVLADLHRAFSRAALELYPGLDAATVDAPHVGASPPLGEEDEEPPTSEVPLPAGERPEIELPLARRQTDAVWKHLCAIPDFWDTLDEIEHGAIARLAAVADAERWELVFLTSRPRTAGRTVQRQSQRWLDRLGFPMPSVYVVHQSRGRIADALALDVVIDDRPDNCLDVVLESKARAVLVWRGHAASVPASAKRLGIGVVPTVAACLDLLVEAQRTSDTPMDFKQRLRRLLGLQSKPAAKD